MSPTTAAAISSPTTTPTMSFAWSSESSWEPENRQQHSASAVGLTHTEFTETLFQLSCDENTDYKITTCVLSRSFTVMLHANTLAWTTPQRAKVPPPFQTHLCCTSLYSSNKVSSADTLSHNVLLLPLVFSCSSATCSHYYCTEITLRWVLFIFRLTSAVHHEMLDILAEEMVAGVFFQ